MISRQSDAEGGKNQGKKTGKIGPDGHEKTKLERKMKEIDNSKQRKLKRSALGIRFYKDLKQFGNKEREGILSKIMNLDRPQLADVRNLVVRHGGKIYVEEV